jgi:hypothetical protein
MLEATSTPPHLPDHIIRQVRPKGNEREHEQAGDDQRHDQGCDRLPTSQQMLGPPEQRPGGHAQRDGQKDRCQERLENEDAANSQDQKQHEAKRLLDIRPFLESGMLPGIHGLAWIRRTHFSPLLGCSIMGALKP